MDELSNLSQPWAPRSPSGAEFKANLRSWLAEDLSHGDITSMLTIPPQTLGSGVIVAKEGGVICGVDIAREVFLLTDPDVHFVARYLDGSAVSEGVIIAEVSGRLHGILAAERLALNLLQRLCGISTLSRAFVEACEGTKAKVLDTRKTTPGLRQLEKYAVRVGGAYNHRFGLFDAVLIKDNHIRAAGGIQEAIRRATGSAPHYQRIEVEVTSIEELEQALELGVEVVLLDNMGVEEMRLAVETTSGAALLEASGNMTLARVREVALTGVDYISVGALTHSAPALDISLNLL